MSSLVIVSVLEIIVGKNLKKLFGAYVHRTIARGASRNVHAPAPYLCIELKG